MTLSNSSSLLLIKWFLWTHLHTSSHFYLSQLSGAGTLTLCWRRSLQFSWRLCFGKSDCKHWPRLADLLHHSELILCNSHHLAFPPPVVQFKVSCSVSQGWNLLSSTQIMWLIATSWNCLLVVGSQTGDLYWSGKEMRWSRILVLPWEWQKCFIWLMPSHLIFFLNFDFLMYVTIRSWGLVAISLDIGLTCLWFLYWNRRGIFDSFSRETRENTVFVPLHLEQWGI